MTGFVRKAWPRNAVGPNGNIARVACPGDIPHGWTLEVPLPGTPAPAPAEEPKRGPGRPRKVAE